jgi:hypothetical protein
MSKDTQVYLADNKKELSKPELKAIRQQVRETMDPEGLKHLWFYLDVIQPGETNGDATHLHNEIKTVITQSVKGVCYKEDLTDGVTYHAELIYNDNGEELLKPWITSRDNTIPVILYCLRVNIVAKLRAFLSGFRDFNKQSKDGGKKPSKGEKEKVIDTLWDLIENAELWPTIPFKIGKDKYKLNKALFEIIEHENGTQKDIILRLNPAVTHDIKKKYFTLPPNFTARRIEISQQLGKKRPEFLTPLVYYIIAMKSNSSLKIDDQGRPYWETGLLKIKSGDPGIFYRFGYLQYEEQRHQQRFLERWATAIEFLKAFEIIEEYSERATNWNDKIGRFTFKAKEKKVG